MSDNTLILLPLPFFPPPLPSPPPPPPPSPTLILPPPPLQRFHLADCQSSIVQAIIEGIVTEAPPSPAAHMAPTTFDERFAAVRERLLRICHGLVGPDHAEDVVHDTYLRARARHHQLREPELFDAWICRAAINLCYTRHRERARLLDRIPMLAERRLASRPSPTSGSVS